MSLQDLGDIGEFIGAIAVVASLIYLGFQIRQNTKAVRRTAHISTVEAFNHLSTLIAQDPEVARISRTGALDIAELNDDERLRFERLMSILVTNLENLFFQHRDGLLEAERWEAYEAVLRDVISSSSFPIVWQHVRHRMSKSFRTHVEDLSGGT
jgi:hypothetical protein